MRLTVIKMENNSEIKNELLKLALFFRDDKLTKQHFDLYANTLKDSSIEDIKYCVNEYCRDPKNTFFPIPPTKILKYLEKIQLDSNSIAVEISSKILQAISKFGYANETSAKNFIGEKGWRAVSRFGGWSYVCQEVGVSINQTTLLAQLREVLKSSINFESANINFKYEDLIEYGNTWCDKPLTEIELSKKKNSSIDFLEKIKLNGK